VGKAGKASMGCNTTFKCPKLTSVKPFSISIHNNGSGSKSSPRTVRLPLGTMRWEMIRGANAKSILVRTMGARISIVRKAVSGIICRTWVQVMRSITCLPLKYLLPGSSEYISCSTTGDTTSVGTKDE